MYFFETTQWLPRRLEEVFPFFSDAANLQAITPPWLHFQVVSPGPVEMRPGTLIDYQLRIRGVPVHWQSEITHWEPPGRFIDEQRKGPYKVWIHEHCFVREGAGTRVIDRVDYDHFGGWLVNRFLVAPDLRRIFGFRQEVLARRFGA